VVVEHANDISYKLFEVHQKTQRSLEMFTDVNFSEVESIGSIFLLQYEKRFFNVEKYYLQWKSLT
jgi:hypothetical protein